MLPWKRKIFNPKLNIKLKRAVRGGGVVITRDTGNAADV
jgi:hypothetical protein